MNDAELGLSEAFCQYYGDPAGFSPYSRLHPISFARVLPFTAQEQVLDVPPLLEAERAVREANRLPERRRVVEELLRCGLLEAGEAMALEQALDVFEGDFFEVIGQCYANAGMPRCALRWYRDRIEQLEAGPSQTSSDQESVYASAGYCLCALGLFAEAVAWSKACLGPRLLSDTVGETLVTYEAQARGATLQTIERAGSRTRYTLRTPDTDGVDQASARLQAALRAFVPFQTFYFDWMPGGGPGSEPVVERFPFKAEVDASNTVRHRTNLFFATLGQADALVAQGAQVEARRWLHEAALLAPQAELVRERLEGLG